MALTRVVLDTSAYTWLRRGHPELAATIVHASWVGVPAVVVGELRAGFALGSKARGCASGGRSLSCLRSSTGFNRHDQSGR